MSDQVPSIDKISLYEILDEATNQELAPIVEFMVASPFSYLKHARAYLRHQPDHTAYRDQIADEIYRLGFFLTESFSTLAGSMPEEKHVYDDLLFAVCKQLGIPVAGRSVKQCEEILINVFIKQHILTVQPDLRAELVKEAAVTAGKVAPGLLSTGAWSPFVSALIEIGFLRASMVVDGRLYCNGKGVSVSRFEPENELSVVDDDGHLAFSLAAIPEEQAKDWSFFVPDGRTKSQLVPFLEALKPYLNAEQMLAGKNIYSSKLPLSWSATKDAFVGVAKGNKGFADLAKVSAIGVAGPAVFLTAAVAIAQQQQMERIEESLDEIKVMLADISHFQQEERRSALTGAIRYLRQVARAILNGELAPEVLHTIEHHEAELNKLYDHITKDLRVASEALRAVRKDTFSSSKYVKAIQDAFLNILRCYDDVLICLRARACGFQLMSAYPGRENGKRARLEAIMEDFRPFLPEGEATVAIDQVFRDKLKSVSSLEAKALLLESESILFDKVVFGSQVILEAISPEFSLAAQTRNVLVMDFEVEAGEIVGVRLPTPIP